MKQTGFHWAAKLGYYKLLNLLLDYGDCCNSFDEKMRTPIYLAALNNQKECVNLLILRGGNPLMCDINGRKPSDVTEDEEIRNILLSYIEKPFGIVNGIISKEDMNKV